LFVYSDEGLVDKWNIAGFMPTQSSKKLRFGVKFPWAPNLNAELVRERLFRKRKN